MANRHQALKPADESAIKGVERQISGSHPRPGIPSFVACLSYGSSLQIIKDKFQKAVSLPQSRFSTFWISRPAENEPQIRSTFRR